MEEKKGTGKVVAIVILIILLIGVLGCLGYGYTKYDSLDKKYKDVSNELLDKEKALNDAEISKKETENTETNYLKYMEYNENYKIYALGYMGAVVGSDDELYLIETNGNSSWTLFNCTREITEGAKFTNNKYLCKDNEYNNDDDMDSVAYKLNVKESDINKVIITHVPSASDATYVVLFIGKDGKVSSFISKEGTSYTKDIVPNKEVKDIDKLHCTTGIKETCKGYSMDVVLKDGTKETVDNIKLR